MTLGSVLISIALLIITGLFILRPVLLGLPAEPVIGQSERLRRRKDALLAQIRQLDYDLETGKMPELEHQHVRGQLVAEAAQLLEQLELLSHSNGDAVPPEQTDDDIEAAVATLRRREAAAELEAAVTRVRKGGNGRHPAAAAKGGFCSQCGRAHEAGDKFCAFCGHRFN